MLVAKSDVLPMLTHAPSCLLSVLKEAQDPEQHTHSNLMPRLILSYYAPVHRRSSSLRSPSCQGPWPWSSGLQAGLRQPRRNLRRPAAWAAPAAVVGAMAVGHGMTWAVAWMRGSKKRVMASRTGEQLQQSMQLASWYLSCRPLRLISSK